MNRMYHVALVNTIKRAFLIHEQGGIEMFLLVIQLVHDGLVLVSYTSLRDH